MTIADLLQPEFDQEMATTRRVLERVPEDKFAWKPHAKSFSMGDLASHIVNTIKWTEATMNQTEFDLGSVSPEEMNQAAKTRAELLAWHDANAASARKTLAKSDADYFVPWTLKQGDTVFFTLPRYNELLPEPHRPPSRAARGVPASERHSRARRVRTVGRRRHVATVNWQLSTLNCQLSG